MSRPPRVLPMDSTPDGRFMGGGQGLDGLGELGVIVIFRRILGAGRSAGESEPEDDEDRQDERRADGSGHEGTHGHLLSGEGCHPFRHEAPRNLPEYCNIMSRNVVSRGSSHAAIPHDLAPPVYHDGRRRGRARSPSSPAVSSAARGTIAPSDTLTKAVIGVGGMGRGHLGYPGSVLRAVCDVDKGHLASALEIAGPGVSGYTDFREVLARPDIDIVHIATPPHWHALIAIAAAEAGKDVWCEKPMTRTIAEGRALVDAVRRTGRIFRVNTWFRFTDRFYGFGTDVRPIKKVVQNGLLGWPIKATVSATTGFDWKFYWSGLTYRPARARAARSSITISGSARRPGSPTIPTASTARSAAIGTTTAAGSGTWACTTSIRSSIFSKRTTRARSRSRPTARSSTRTPAAAGGGSR